MELQRHRHKQGIQSLQSDRQKTENVIKLGKTSFTLTYLQKICQTMEQTRRGTTQRYRNKQHKFEQIIN